MNAPQGVIGFMGMPATGKTYRMRQRFWDALRVIVYNFASGFGPVGECRSNQNPLPGFQFYYSVPDLVQAMQRAGSGRIRARFSPVASAVANGKPLDKRDVFDLVTKNVNAFSRQCGATVYAVDEVWNGCTASWSPENFNASFCQWRHYDLCLMWTAQRPADVDKALRTMSTEIYAGRLLGEDEVEAVRKCGFTGELISKLPALKNREFIHRLETGEWSMVK